jgi:hypothetical protein
MLISSGARSSEYCTVHTLDVFCLPYAKQSEAVEALICLFIFLKLYELLTGLKSKALMHSVEELVGRCDFEEAIPSTWLCSTKRQAVA